MKMSRDFRRSGQYEHVKLQLAALDPRFGDLIKLHEDVLAKAPGKFGEYDEESGFWIAKLDDIPATLYYTFEYHVIHLVKLEADLARD